MEGFYLLADDTDWPAAETTLKSLRVHHPGTRLILIPRSSHIRRIETLAETFFSNQELTEADQLGVQLSGEAHPGYRKLLAWKGPLQRFICLEAPCVATDSLLFLIQELANWGFIFGSSREDSFRPWIWHSSAFLNTPLTNEQLAFSAPTSIFASRRDALDWLQMDAAVGQARALRQHMNLASGEAALINYLVTTAPAPRTSLLEWNRWGRDRRCLLWAGQKGGRVQAGNVLFQDGRKVVGVHWAGCWKPRWWRPRPYQRLWDHYQAMG